ncbi:hypothetical protein FPRO03_10047 [Fusarium proliferatum]|nr:hypothetical protein FPRO03_10047 [Fusarium proliferatum]
MTVESSPVIVIGGGIVGASIAWHLAKEKKDKFYYDFRRRSMARWAEMDKELPDLPIRWGGVLACDRTPEERQEFYERQRQWDTKTRRMEETELAVIEPQVDEEQLSLVKWGLHVPE